MRSAAANFYGSASNAQLQTLKDILVITGDRQHSIGVMGTWGEGVDISAFATIHQVVIQAIVLTLTHSKET